MYWGDVVEKILLVFASILGICTIEDTSFEAQHQELNFAGKVYYTQTIPDKWFLRTSSGDAAMTRAPLILALALPVCHGTPRVCQNSSGEWHVCCDPRPAS